MAKRKGGMRRKSRQLLTKNARAKGKISLAGYFASFKEGERVYLLAEPAVQKGMYFPRYYGLMGTVKAKRGSCYEVQISDRGAKKTLIVHPIHLKKFKKE